MISESTSFSHSFSFNDLQRVHPLSLSPQHRHSVSAHGQCLDDVTTIFVVGFPEDMAEREFQNMFTFCSGFEAASLKWHCKDQEELLPPQGKKQMIGFARFRTRLEALESIEVLSGKKVDQDKGTVLKAEMAKKNLHIKRSLGINTAVNNNNLNLTAGSVSSSTSSTFNSHRVSSLHPAETKTLSGPYEDFSPLPSDLFSELKNEICPEPVLSHRLSDSLFAIRSHSFDQGFVSRFGLAPCTQAPSSPRRANFMNDTKADPYLQPDPKPRLGSLSIQRTHHAADQNPPCNTLYVGNLSAHTSEEELCSLFALHKGYRRMCFRTKSQGPMCFVEFEDLLCASHALNALQGHTLSNSVKGGIRLSFSKNPLFIKPAKENGTIHFKHLGHPSQHEHNKRDFAFDPQL